MVKPSAVARQKGGGAKASREKHLFVLTFFWVLFCAGLRVAASAKAGQDKKVPTLSIAQNPKV
jgi:hypothetical protein